MLAETLISPSLPNVAPGDAATNVLAWMREHQTADLAVVDDRELLGTISSAALERALAPGVTLADVPLQPADGRYVFTSQHAFDALSIMGTTGTSIVPVVDLEQHYMGSIGREDMVRYMGEMAAAAEPGGIIVLEVERLNYQLREIASIVESDNARVLSVHISPVPDSTNLYVTLKVNVSELSQILLSFERYGYKVSYTFFDAKQLDDTQDRFESLLRYLNV